VAGVPPGLVRVIRSPRELPSCCWVRWRDINARNTHARGADSPSEAKAYRQGRQTLEEWMAQLVAPAQQGKSLSHFAGYEQRWY